MVTRGMLGRADLLRLLAMPDQQEAVHWLADALGLRERADSPVEPSSIPTPRIESAPAQPEPEASVDRRPPLRARMLVTLQNESFADTPSIESRPPLTPADCLPRLPNTTAFKPLVERTRLWPALQRHLAFTRPGRLDIGAFVRTLSKARIPRHLPRLPAHGWGSELLVVFDVAERLTPYQSDYCQILREVQRLHGDSGLVVWTVAGTPDAPLSVRHGRGKPRAARTRFPVPAPNVPVLILSDLGVLSRNPDTVAAWRAFTARLASGGGRPVAWMPVSRRWVDADLLRSTQVHCLGSGDLRALRQAGERPAQVSEETLDGLLTRMACCVRVEPALLRSLRQLDPKDAAEPGLEGLIWSHTPVVRAGERFCELAPEHVMRFREHFELLPTGMQQQILASIRHHHAHRGRATESSEAIIWRAHARPQADTGDLRAYVDDAACWFERLSAAPERPPGDWVAFARELFTRQGQDKTWLNANSAALAPLWALTRQDDIPGGLDPRHVHAARAQSHDGQTVTYALTQQNDDAVLVPMVQPTPFPAPPWNATLADPLAWDARIEVREGFEWSRMGSQQRTWIPARSTPIRLPWGDDPDSAVYELHTGRQRVRLAWLTRPSWASETLCTGKGCNVWAPSPTGNPVALPWLPFGELPARWPPAPKGFRSPPVNFGPGLTLGADLEFGLYLDVSLAGVVQRFRWIEPGEFVMGSEEGETGRYDAEGPRHVVRITAGFWLGETACSQAMWEAVTRSNPSHFRDDPQNPVELVSWDDVQGFLRQVEELIPGLKADLPTEAEWEYACRAGTETAFSWGDDIDPSQANYGTRASDRDDPTGASRRRTVPVRSHAPNGWGLYQMHGNVWEWCADGLRPYDGSAQVDPRGPEGEEAEAPRALRGGSWISGPRRLRSACRDGRRRGRRSHVVGFRFALRSTRPGAERLPEATAALEGPQGISPAPGRGRGGETGGSDPARRNAGPAGTFSWLRAKRSDGKDKA